ncbi:hypothetical protein ACRALDRAFT_212771 [Sodiomyces alcalophilus JCM 7366]|uniref:uncharacterized protein n=1 Tax=Sodiomyces alcalophilus JCM 7366 TaxID=591952 RepID=UPI0039B4372F
MLCSGSQKLCIREKRTSKHRRVVVAVNRRRPQFTPSSVPLFFHLHKPHHYQVCTFDTLPSRLRTKIDLQRLPLWPRFFFRLVVVDHLWLIMERCCPTSALFLTLDHYIRNRTTELQSPDRVTCHISMDPFYYHHSLPSLASPTIDWKTAKGLLSPAANDHTPIGRTHRGLRPLSAADGPIGNDCRYRHKKPSACTLFFPSSSASSLLPALADWPWRPH